MMKQSKKQLSKTRLPKTRLLCSAVTIALMATSYQSAMAADDKNKKTNSKKLVTLKSTNHQRVAVVSPCR